MGRTVKGRNIPEVKPVEKIELSEKHIGLRIFLVIILLAIGAGAFAYGINALFSSEPGWQEIKADSRAEANCSDDFVFLYNLGVSGVSATAENKALITLYTDAAEKAYQLFHNKESFENVNNVYYINRHPNEEIVVDEVLYKAFELLKTNNNRNIYLASVYMHYDDIFYCHDDSQLIDFDPYLNEDVAEDYQEITVFANDPEAVDIQLLGDNKIKLFISDEYSMYAEENDITEFIDFFWMKNAFIIDYFADMLIEKGYTAGSISSFDGFSRNLDKSDTSYSFNIYDRVGQSIYRAAVMQYQGQKSIVYLRDYMLTGLDDKQYYQLDNGEVRTSYVDVTDGFCKSAMPSLYGYSKESGCAEILMQMIPVYIADEFRPDAIDEMSENMYSVYCEDNVIYYNDESLVFSDVYSVADVKYTTQYLE